MSCFLDDWSCSFGKVSYYFKETSNEAETRDKNAQTTAYFSSLEYIHKRLFLVSQNVWCPTIAILHYSSSSNGQHRVYLKLMKSF